jgi:hypothetical protein
MSHASALEKRGSSASTIALIEIALRQIAEGRRMTPLVVGISVHRKEKSRCEELDAQEFFTAWT